MKIAIGTDHGAISYKHDVVKHLKELGHEVLDFGTNTSDSVDYPDYALHVSESIISGNADCGILMCGTGIGMSLAANKVSGIRAAVVPNANYARLAKEHNNANIICLSGRFMSIEECISSVDAYLDAHFAGDDSDDSGKRHLRRVEKIMEIESKYDK